MTSPQVMLNLDGYTDLPPGKIAAIVTYLEMRSPPPMSPAEAPGTWTLQRLNVDHSRYRTLYRRIGEPWLWFSRVVMPDEELSGILDDPKVEAYALHDGTDDIGLLELDFRPEREVELAFLGLAPGIIGKGAGRFLMSEAIRRAFAQPIDRFFVHTCSLDHPAALTFYMRAGFTPYRRAIEVSDDPRLQGFLPRECAPQIPVIADL
ncbi:GNAT family N-acetyltransferase [Microvirga guangxiensis]|uniref:Acetyltransferase (GNAT) domain-containing protein n=1 Tax=Microvirga guangxiensis TaxID=549386 RepID=A0A1G5CMM5_9HYPH|nr:GNAT family N-acetyltransferase [Microvirga guangxiensis]SCY03652.1 Acetyltransferase (GNAT) domain-containing protein [Microvirga guangxiensis]